MLWYELRETLAYLQQQQQAWRLMMLRMMMIVRGDIRGNGLHGAQSWPSYRSCVRRWRAFAGPARRNAGRCRADRDRRACRAVRGCSRRSGAFRARTGDMAPAVRAMSRVLGRRGVTAGLWRPVVTSASSSMLLFGCSSVLTVVNKRKAKFLDNYLKSYNNLCKLFAYVAENEERAIAIL